MNYKVFYSFCFFVLIMLVTFPVSVYSQKVSEILENGIVVKDKNAIFLRLKDNKLNFEVGEKNSNNFDPLKESFFLLHGNGVNVYMSPPLNPLSYTTSTEISFSNDEINTNAAEALGAIIAAISKLTTPLAPSNATPPTPAPGKPGKPIPVIVKVIDSTCIKKFIKVKEDLDGITVLLKLDKKKELNEIFKILKDDLDFEDKGVTNEKMTNANKKYEVVENHYNKIGNLIETTKKDLSDYETCVPAPVDNFIKVFVINQILKEQQNVYQGYMTTLKKLNSIYSLVKTVYDSSEGEGKGWQILLGRVSMEENKIATYTVSVNTDGYTLTKEDEITKTTKKSIITTSLKFRKFQRFIPEVSVGFAFTSLKFPKYGTSTDATTGKQVVTDAGEDEFKKMNFTSMINFNYYIANSPVHPFWQIGIGANAGYPTFFTGIGGRLNILLKRMAVSTGFAGTWIKTLSKLKVGDVVSGTADIEKDIKYEFSFPLKPYIGFQYNF